MKYVVRPSNAPFGPHGVGWAFLDSEGQRPIRVIAMGVVKPANDDEEFYYWRSLREMPMFDYRRRRT